MRQGNRSLLYKLVMSLVILGSVALAVSACQRDDGAVEVDQSTPEATLRAMYRSLEHADADLLESLIDPVDPTRRQMPEALRRMKASGVTYELVSLEVFSISNDGKTALMSASEHARLHQHDKVLTDTEGSPNFTLTNTDGKWYLVGLGQWPSPGWVKP